MDGGGRQPRRPLDALALQLLACRVLRRDPGLVLRAFFPSIAGPVSTRRRCQIAFHEARASWLSAQPSVMRGQKRVHKGVHARLRRAMDARERAYDPRIHLLRKNFLRRSMDCRGVSASTRVFDTLLPGNDREWDSYLVRHGTSVQGSISSP